MAEITHPTLHLQIIRNTPTSNPMKRRTFLTALATLTATPALPAGALSPAAAKHLPLASLLARSHNHCTRDMLQRNLKLSPDMAAQVHDLLLNRGIITRPINGISMATAPTNTHCVPKQALKPSNLIRKATDLRSRLRELLQDDDAPTQKDAPRDVLPNSEAVEKEA